MWLQRLLVAGLVLNFVNPLELKNGAYEELVIKIADNVPEVNCRNILDNLEGTLTSASQYLFSALDSRAYLRSATVLLPSSWSDSCVPSVSSAVLGASGEISDITILPGRSVRGNIYTQQSLGCGQPGDQIYVSYESLKTKQPTLPRLLIKEFAKYRYGVFDEQGYFNDPVYPMCFQDDINKTIKLTGCSDLPIKMNDLCGLVPPSDYNVTELVDSNARSSILFAAEAPSVSMFCDDGNHDRIAPTKHNLICQRRSVLDVIIKHSDFLKANTRNNNFHANEITDTTPTIVYKKQNVTRYVFVIENNKDMLQRESWSYLRLAMRFWALYDVTDTTELGLVLSTANPVRNSKILQAKKYRDDGARSLSNREKFFSVIPYTPSESIQSGCLHCSLKIANDMLVERTRTHGPASNVIVVIAPGMTVTDQIRTMTKELKKNKIRVATINYPDILRPSTLRFLADETNGVDYTVFEKKLNAQTTMLTTYFELHNVLYDIVRKFYSGSQTDLAIEIHRREITDKNGRPFVSGTFIMDPSVSNPAWFTLFTHNTITPLFKSLKLASPSNQVDDSRTDRFIDFKMIGLISNFSESGTWTYNLEPYPGNPQPHYLQVMATPISPFVPVVRASFKLHVVNPGLFILMAEAKYGDLPILGAKIEVAVTKIAQNGTHPKKMSIYLLDTGSGDPDITKGDGVYTRYFSPDDAGLYTFETVVTNNDNTAYTWSSSKNGDDTPCCGSSIKSYGAQQITPFQRVLSKETIMVTPEDIRSQVDIPISVGRIGDLRVEVLAEDMRAKLTWTSPDMAGQTVSRYEVRYAFNAADILDKFETATLLWETGSGALYPMDPGSETSYMLDLSQNKPLLDKPLYFAIKSYGGVGANLSGPVSNFVRIFIPSPPPPPTIAPTFSHNELSIWPNHVKPLEVDLADSSVSHRLPIQIILPVIIGLIILVVVVVVYCYFCVVRKRTVSNQNNAKENAIKKDDLSSTITIVPNSTQTVSHESQTYQGQEMPDPHQVGVPINNYAYEDETKKRYSLVNQQEQQLIEELKQQQQQMHHQHQHDTLPPAYSGLSVISNNTINRNGQPLSPYNSWSASQLLHEHERRYSPLENIMNDETTILTPQEVLAQMDHLSLNGQSMDHMSVNGHQINEQYAPPVPPLPTFNNGGYPVNYNIYGVHQGPPQQHQHLPQQQQIYQSIPRTEHVPFNSNSLQGSMNSVNSSEKKRRNVTMV